MKIEVYHQLGHNGVWGLESFQNEGCGDGVILSPRNMKRIAVENLPVDVRSRSIFDPQFFNPHIINKQMKTYGFYPDSITPGGYDTKQFPAVSSICAEKCINFQKENVFKFLTIPTQYVGNSVPVDTLIEHQNEYFINPFLDIIKKEDLKNEIIVQIILTNEMIKNPESSSNLLDWITGIEGITGVYLITESKANNKQINDPEYLYSLLKFVQSLSDNKLKTVLGYQNTEAMLLSLADPSIVTMGSYFNVRSFDYARDYENMGAERQIQQPKPRVYIPDLLDWIDIIFIQSMNRRIPNFKKLLGDNQYTDEMLKPTYQINKIVPPYKHFFVEGSKQLKTIGSMNPKDRYSYLQDTIESAIERFTSLDNLGFVLGGCGSHLSSWLTAANWFADDQGWR